MSGFESIFERLPYTNECICNGIVEEEYSPLYKTYNFAVIIVLVPLVSLFGLWSNCVNVFLYSRQELINSQNSYLTALATSDFFVIVNGLVVFWCDSARAYVPELSAILDQLPLALAAGYVAQTCSVYFTVFAAVDCYVSVCWSFYKSIWCTVGRARMVILIVILGSAGYNSLRFGQFQLHQCFSNDSMEEITEVCPTRLFQSINLIYNVYMYMLLMAFLPFIMLSILNALIVARVNKSRRAFRASLIDINGISATPVLSKNIRPIHQLSSHSSLGGEIASISAAHPQSSGGGGEVSASDTVTMIMVVILFLGCNTLALIINVYETFFLPDKLVINFMTDTSNFLVMLNSSVNYVIYMIFSEEFRRLFNRHICCNGGHKKANGDGKESQTSHEQQQQQQQSFVNPKQKQQQSGEGDPTTTATIRTTSVVAASTNADGTIINTSIVGLKGGNNNVLEFNVLGAGGIGGAGGAGKPSTAIYYQKSGTTTCMQHRKNDDSDPPPPIPPHQHHHQPLPSSEPQQLPYRSPQLQYQALTALNNGCCAKGTNGSPNGHLKRASKFRNSNPIPSSPIRRMGFLERWGEDRGGMDAIDFNKHHPNDELEEKRSLLPSSADIRAIDDDGIIDPVGIEGGVSQSPHHSSSLACYQTQL